MNFGTYILLRLVSVFAQLLGSIALVFVLLNFIPYDPTVFFLFNLRGTTQAQTEALVAAYRASLGIDVPIYVQYFRFIRGLFFQGSLGTSWTFDSPVRELIGDSIIYTLFTFGIAFLIYTPIAFILGIVSAKYRGGLFDFLSRLFTSIAYSIPSYILGLFFIVWSIERGLQLAPWPVNFDYDVFNLLKFSVLPIIVVILIYSGFQFRLVRRQILEIMQKEYIRTARAKGLPERLVIYKHALVNLLPFFIMTIAITFPIAFSGVVALEVVFNIPGIGLLMVDAARTFDWPVLLGVTAVFTVINAFMLLLTDILTFMVSPKLRISYMASN